MKTGTKTAKKTAFNVIMAVAAAVIVIGAVMIAGSLQGWFDGGGQTAQGGTAAVAAEAVTAENKTGSANIEREGIAYSLEDGTKLRDGDIIETLNGSSVELALPAGAVSLNQNTEAVVRIGEDGFSIELTNGEAFVNTDGAFTLRLAELETDVTAASGVFSASAPAGSANVYVYENSVSAGGIEVSAGQAVSLYADGQAPSVAALSLAALNDFDIGQVRAANETKTLCFTNGELDALAAEREEQLRSALKQQQAEQEKAQQIEEQRQNNQNGTGGSASGTGSSAAGGASGSTGGSGSSGGASGRNGRQRLIRKCRKCGCGASRESHLHHRHPLQYDIRPHGGPRGGQKQICARERYDPRRVHPRIQRGRNGVRRFEARVLACGHPARVFVDADV